MNETRIDVNRIQHPPIIRYSRDHRDWRSELRNYGINKKITRKIAGIVWRTQKAWTNDIKPAATGQEPITAVNISRNRQQIMALCASRSSIIN